MTEVILNIPMSLLDRDMTLLDRDKGSPHRRHTCRALDMVTHCDQYCHNHFNNILVTPSFSHSDGHYVMVDAVVAAISIIEHINNQGLHYSSIVTEELIYHDGVLGHSTGS